MKMSHHFGVELEEYAEKGKENDLPLLEICPNCQCLGPGNIHRHGYYCAMESRTI